MSKPVEAVAPKSWSSFLEDAAALAGVRLYLDGPFRLLNASVLASTRDLTRRFDAVQMGVELGTETWSWAFAPVQPREENLRQALQTLKDPRLRFFCEVFWFWPETYPEPGEDAALNALDEGNVARAVDVWAEKSPDESPAALHNLAVYHHLMALEQELAVPTVPDEDKLAWWRAAVRYWQDMLAHDACWERVQRRAANLADPQVDPEWVPRLRAVFPDLLAGINSALALKYAEANDTASAARQVALLGEIYSDGEAAQRALERGVAPVVRRVDARLHELRSKVAADAAGGLDAAGMTVLDCAQDLDILITLCESNTPIYREVCTQLASAVLDSVVAFQRETADHEAGLPLVLWTKTLPASPEVSARAKETYRVLFANALEHRDPSHGDDPAYAKRYAVLRESVIPRLLQSDLGQRRIEEACIPLLQQLDAIAEEACDERDDIDFAIHVLDTAVMLPGSETQKAKRSAQRDQFHRAFVEQKSRELHMELGDSQIEISRHGVVWKETLTPLNAITGLRHGRTGAAAGGSDYVVAWRTSEREIVLDGHNAFADPATADEWYSKIVDALYFFAASRLIERMSESIIAGETVQVGTAILDHAGVKLSGTGRLWARGRHIAYSRLEQTLQEGAWVVGPADNNRVREYFPTVEVWNAAIIGYVIDAIALR